MQIFILMNSTCRCSLVQVNIQGTNKRQDQLAGQLQSPCDSNRRGGDGQWKDQERCSRNSKKTVGTLTLASPLLLLLVAVCHQSARHQIKAILTRSACRCTQPDKCHIKLISLIVPQPVACKFDGAIYDQLVFACSQSYFSHSSLSCLCIYLSFLPSMLGLFVVTERLQARRQL